MPLAPIPNFLFGVQLKRVIIAESQIEAPLEHVWRILEDVTRYPEWNPFTRSVETTFALGSPVVMRVQLGSYLRNQTEFVSAFEPPHRMCWGRAFVAAPLMRVDRCQTLEALSPRRTRYRTVDTLGGILVPVTLALFGKAMQRGFQGVAETLKVRAESELEER